MSLPIAGPKLLLGEGEDEVRFFRALLRDLAIRDVQVEKYQGKSNLGYYLRTLVALPDFGNVVSLGVTRDADDNIGGAFQSVRSALQRAGLAVPTAPGIMASGSPPARAFILPDNASPGMLEDLCLSSVQAHPGHSCLDVYFQCASAAGRIPSNRAKARVHAWLASEAEPEKRLGEAAAAGYWPWTNPAFAPLITFVRSL